MRVEVFGKALALDHPADGGIDLPCSIPLSGWDRKRNCNDLINHWDHSIQSANCKECNSHPINQFTHRAGISCLNLASLLQKY